MSAAHLQGRIVAAFGRQYEVLLDDDRTIAGIPLGKKSPYACGDRVEVELSSPNQGQILRNLERTSLLYRSDEWKQKLIAANATQLVLVCATEPGFTDELLTRALVAAEHDGIKAVIVLNKCDLTAGLAAARQQLAPFAALGYPIVELSAKEDASAIKQLLAGHISVLVGQSGMGKSTLINALVPGAAAATREISEALDSGKHTTTHARLYALDGNSAIIDSPGLQEFGLAHLTVGEIENAFPEFRPHVGHCRFRDCHHGAEPDCAVKKAVAEGLIHPRRLEHFRKLIAGR
ncbi:ribosome small subunit-dependent GTPase A [Denitratisoma sp. agr-D3]